jgi:hypothetical protein
LAILDLLALEAEYSGQDVTSLPDRPSEEGWSAAAIKSRFDRLGLLALEKYNGLVGALSALGIDDLVISGDVRAVRITSDGQIEINRGGEDDWTATASSGHVILDAGANVLPQRGRMKFLNAAVTDTGEETVITGIAGPQGAQGVQGVQGERGEQGLRGKVFVPAISDLGVVSWTLLDQAAVPAPRNIRGPQGIQGIQGVQGPAGPAGSTGATGAQGPRGDAGEKGDRGDAGPAGPSGAQGPAGAQGPQGAQGERGDDGADGRSFTVLALYATLLALQMAHPSGEAGDAYAVGTALSNTIYIWDEDAAAWTNVGALQGPQGPQGAQGAAGPQGAAATVAVGTVTTGAAGSQAAVANSGTVTDAVFDFTVPKGDKGEKGDRGDTGETGAEGAQGEIGPQGIQGPEGEQGIQGPEGLQGPQGNPTTVNNKSGLSITLDGADIALTGYSKAGSASAIAASDTVNAAAGKLEYKLDAHAADSANPHAVTGAQAVLTGYEKPASSSALAGTDTVNAALGKLEKGLEEKIPASEKDSADGVASLDANEKVTAAQASARIVTVTGNKTLALLDAGTAQYVNSSSNLTVTIPTNSSVAFPVGTEIEIFRAGSGTVTLGVTGLTIQCKETARTIADRYTSVVIKKWATDVWSIQGNVG